MSVINMINKSPFYAWNCLTLHRRSHQGDIYLVIKNDEAMKKLLLFLIHKLETVDGNRGSATLLIKM